MKFIGTTVENASQSRQVASADPAKSGANANDKMKNLYDLEGNHAEWTLEANGTGTRTYRGGLYKDAYYGRYYPANDFDNVSPTTYLYYYSARLTLYL